jgi:hypothetical protein
MVITAVINTGRELEGRFVVAISGVRIQEEQSEHG